MRALYSSRNWASFCLYWTLPMLAIATVELRAQPRSGSIHRYGEPTDTSGVRLVLITLNRTGYQVCYDDTNAIARWVGYHLAKIGEPGDHVKASERSDAFATDTETRSQVRPTAYADAGISDTYDRGHLAPAYGIGTRYGPAAEILSYRMSNMAPQHFSLNRGVWKSMEKKEADLYANGYDGVWIIDGPVYDLRAGPPRSPALTMPTGFFKIMMVFGADRRPVIQAFYFRNEKPGTPKGEAYLTSVADLEAVTNLNFFPLMPRALQIRLESAKPTRLWTVNGKN